MVLNSCEITLDNNWGTYYAGQTVTGRVEIVVDAPKKVRGVAIAFKGEANTHWTTEESHTSNEGKQEKETIELTGLEEYFKINYYLIGGQGGEVIIPPGHHTYPFTCVLPPTLPSSFEGEHGFIRYTIKVTLDRPWKFDQESKRAFTVLSPVDLNLNSRLKEPARHTLEKYFCCFWCQSGPLTCVISIPFTGYVPGQVIPIIAEIDNISNVEITNVQFTLKKIVTYHCQSPRKETRKDEKIITELTVGPVAPHGSNTWNQSMTIPSVPPSNLVNCNLIDLDYELYILVNISGCHSNIDAKIPITIGTVPLAVAAAPFMPPSSAPPHDSTTVINMNAGAPPNNQAIGIGWVGSGDTNGSAPATGPVPYGTYPAVPSFAQSVFGTTTIKEKGDSDYVLYSNNQSQYSPMYPVYNVTTQ